MIKAKLEIPAEVAVYLCGEIRQQYRGKWWTVPGMWCLGCTLASKGDMTKICISNAPGYRGCGLVNGRYNNQLKNAG